jgi:hypothetical protein
MSDREERLLCSLAMTYIAHGLITQQELEGMKYLLKDSTDRRAIQVFNNGDWYDTRKDYFL